jgi:hypothetical protein
MGGFASSILEHAGESLERGLQNTTSKAGDFAIGRLAQDLGGNKEWLLDLTPEGKAISKMNEEYHRVRTSALGDSNKDVKAVMDWNQSSDAVRNTLPLKTATLGEMHQYAESYNHPIAKTTQKLLDAGGVNPQTKGYEYAPKTLEQIHIANQHMSRLTGLGASYGDEYQNAIPLVASLQTHPDPRIKSLGQRVSDIISSETKDTTEIMGTPASKFKLQANKTFSTLNKYVENSNIPPLKTYSTYEPKTQLEYTADRALRMVQIPFVAIPHVGQYFNLLGGSPVSQIGKALLSWDADSMSKIVDQAHVTANTQWDAIYTELLGRTGKVANWTDKPTLGSIFSKTMHQPGFNWLRTKQLSAAGAVGYHSAIYWAKNAMDGNKAAIAELTEMGIDFKEVAAQGGKLNEEQLTKGVYHFVNNRFFMNKTIDNSLLQNKNFVLRGAFMYHSFIASQKAFIMRQVIKSMKAGDYKGLAQFVGTLGVVFPFVAPMLKSAELYLRTGSSAQAGNSIQHDYKALSGQSGLKEFNSTYWDMISHLGAMGAAYNYFQAMKSHRLANAAMGPMIGDFITHIEDAWGTGTRQPGAARLLGRDLTQDIPLIGKPLSHKLFPTHAEEGSTSTGLRSSYRRRGFGGRRF